MGINFLKKFKVQRVSFQCCSKKFDTYHLVNKRISRNRSFSWIQVFHGFLVIKIRRKVTTKCVTHTNLWMHKCHWIQEFNGIVIIEFRNFMDKWSQQQKLHESPANRRYECKPVKKRWAWTLQVLSTTLNNLNQNQWVGRLGQPVVCIWP